MHAFGGERDFVLFGIPAPTSGYQDVDILHDQYYDTNATVLLLLTGEALSGGVCGGYKSVGFTGPWNK